MCAKRDKKPGFDSEFDGIKLKIKLRGEIDHHAAAVMRVSMDDLIRSRKPQIMELDMSAVDFMDSSGLGLIMGRYALMQQSGGEMYVLDPSPATEKIMKLAGMERMINIRRSNARAVRIDSAVRGAEREIKRRSAHHKTHALGSMTAKAEAVTSKKADQDKRGEVK